MGSKVNDEVEDWAEATGLGVEDIAEGYEILWKGRSLGKGKTIAAACAAALSAAPESDRAQAIFMLGALSHGPEALFAALDDVWGDSEGDPDSEDDGDGGSDDIEVEHRG